MKLREYVQVGICNSYGDGDFRVSMEVATMSDEDYAKLQAGMFGAIWQMNDIRRREKMAQHPAQQAKEQQ